MRCEMFVWTIFSWLIVLTNVQLSLCSSCSEDHFEDQAIDFDQISKAGITIKAVGVINVSSAEECAKSCCENTSDKCNIITFSINPTNSCIRFFCQPLEQCFLKKSAQNDHTIKLNTLFDTTISSISQSSTSVLDTSNTENPNQTSSTEFLTSTATNCTKTFTEKSHENITAIDVGILKSKEILSATGINSTLAEYLLSQNISSNKSSTESATSNYAETSPDDISTTSKKKKDESYSVKEINNETTTERDITSNPLDEVTPTLSSSNVYVGTSSSSKGSINLTNLTTTENEIITNGIAINEVKDEKNATPSIFNVTVKSELMISNETEPEIFDVTVNSKLIIRNETESSTLNSSPDLNLTMNNETESSTFHSFNNSTFLMNNETEPTAFNVTVNSSLTISNETEEQISAVELVGESDQLKKDIHLIVALVIGLMLLLTVLGLVVRKFYDGWQRRHYQRMDFLIDGMYNSPST